MSQAITPTQFARLILKSGEIHEASYVMSDDTREYYYAKGWDQAIGQAASALNIDPAWCVVVNSCRSPVSGGFAEIWDWAERQTGKR